MLRNERIVVPGLGWRRFRWMTALTFLLCFLFSSGASAHAILVKAVPTQGSELKTSPSTVTLTFNERVEKELFYIRAYNQLGKQVTSEPAMMSEDQHQISLKLPPLKDGVYTVSYHVISDDGHPVEEAYTFSVGNASNEANMDNSTLGGSHHGSASTFIIRILYYLSLLGLSGWILWGALYPISSKIANDGFLYWLQNFRHFFLVMVLGMGITEITGLLSGLSLNDLLPLLTKTPFGISWICSLFLAFIGYSLLHRSKWLDMVWVLLILGLEGINGHAITYKPVAFSVLVDIFHLIVASLWVGGIFYIGLLWRRDKEHIKKFLPVFSRTALFSILVLIVTGLLLTYLFVPKFSHLFVTFWGILLTIKIVLVILVIIIAEFIRVKMRQKDVEKIWHWFKFDFTVMILIVGIVGVLTYLSPLPENEPLIWDESWDGVQMKSQITPNVPGENRFQIDLYLPQEGVKIKQIQLYLINKDHQGVAPIQVPLKLHKQTDSGDYSYISVGPYLPFAGEWSMQIRLLDSNDDETVHTKDFTIY